MHGTVVLPENALGWCPLARFKIKINKLEFSLYFNYCVCRNTRKKLSKKPLVRKSIKTASRYDLQRGKKRREMIAASKKRKTTHT